MLPQWSLIAAKQREGVGEGFPSTAALPPTLVREIAVEIVAK